MNEFYRLIGNIFYFFALIVFIVAVTIDYYNVFLKDKGLRKEKIKFQNPMLIFISFTMTLISIQFILAIFLIINILMLLRLYIIKRSITHLVMVFTMASGLLTLIATLVDNIPITGAWELSYVGNIITITFLLATALAGPVEDRIKKSETKFRGAFNRAEFYKDLFAHDISNILQNVKTSLELVSQWYPLEDKKEEIDKIFNIMDEQVTRGSKLVDNIRKFSQVEEEILNLGKVNLITNLDLSVKFIAESYPTKDIRIQRNYEFKELYVNANDLLLDVFENILINAVKYNDKSQIEIEIEISKIIQSEISYIKIEFKDNGIGIPDEMKEVVFKSVIKNRGKVKGMGLGLLLVKRILDNYNGKIWVEDKVKGDYTKGSNFIMVIPEVV
jgi:signal transduction histidine kinase